MKARLTVGVVDNAADKAKSGRASVKLPEVGGQTYPEPLEPIVMSGWHWPPEPGDLVEAVVPDSSNMSEFAEEVYYLGTINDKQHPVAKEFHTNYPHRRGFKTKAGLLLIVDDRDKSITVQTPNGILVKVSDAGIFLGGGAASEPMVLGTLWQQLMSDFFLNYLGHTHQTGTGPSGPPVDTPLTTPVSTLKSNVDAGNHISDFIKGQKVAP